MTARRSFVVRAGSATALATPRSQALELKTQDSPQARRMAALVNRLTRMRRAVVAEPESVADGVWLVELSPSRRWCPTWSPPPSGCATGRACR